MEGKEEEGDGRWEQEVGRERGRGGRKEEGEEKRRREKRMGVTRRQKGSGC